MIPITQIWYFVPCDGFSQITSHILHNRAQLFVWGANWLQIYGCPPASLLLVVQWLLWLSWVNKKPLWLSIQYKSEFWRKIYGLLPDKCSIIFGCPACSSCFGCNSWSANHYFEHCWYIWWACPSIFFSIIMQLWAM